MALASGSLLEKPGVGRMILVFLNFELQTCSVEEHSILWIAKYGIPEVLCYTAAVAYIQD